MKWLDSSLTWMFPTFLLDGTPWYGDWREKERISTVNVLRMALPIVSVAWLSHYFLYDRPMNLEPIDDWLSLRLTGAAVCLLALPAYFEPIRSKIRFNRLPALIAFLSVIYLQSISVVWHGQQTWVFLFIMIMTFSLVLRMSSVESAVFCIVGLLVSLPNLVSGGVSTPNIVTGLVVTVVAVMVVRTSYLLDIRNFLLAQQHEEAQEKLLKLSNDFSSRLKSFIPKTIANRIERAVSDGGLSVLQASVEVLEPKKRQIACLFSDIRGFTQGSKDLDKFVENSVLPEVKVCTDAIEANHGIPRKIGDLVFAYFDDDSPELNLFRAVMSGMEVARLNSDMNATAGNAQISRYILIDAGEAIVGNLGGHDSSVEITALGSPVNFLARLDDVTKHPKLQSQILPGDLLLSSKAMDMILGILEGTEFELEYTKIDLVEPGIEVRDFPDTTSIYTLRSSDTNYASLLAPYEYVTKRLHEQSSSQI